MSGLSIVITSEVSALARVGGAAFLVFGSMLDFLVPIGAYLAPGDRAHRELERAKVCMVAHTRAISIGMFLVLGTVFLVRGIGKL